MHKQTDIARDPSSSVAATPVRDVFEQCRRNEKLYLEEQIRQIPPEYLKLHTSEDRNHPHLPVKCIQFAQQTFNGSYGLCENEEARPKVTRVKPCLTESYVMLTYNSYNDVMDCFNLNPSDYYLQIFIESGFHLNAINRTGFDSGLAQFTSSGIKKVTANNLVERVRRILLESSRPSCQRISSIVGSFDIEGFSVQKRCSMISLPKNPYRGMLFNYLHSMLDEISLQSALTGIPEIQSALTPKIKKQLVFLAYNKGISGVYKLLKSYAATRSSFNHVITESDLDLNKNLSLVQKILRLEPEKRALLKRSRVRKLTFAEYAVIHGAGYLSNIATARDYVHRTLGNSCGDL